MSATVTTIPGTRLGTQVRISETSDYVVVMYEKFHIHFKKIEEGRLLYVRADQLKSRKGAEVDHDEIARRINDATRILTEQKRVVVPRC